MALKTGIRINQGDLKNLKDKIDKLRDYPKEVFRIATHEANNAVGRMKQDAPVDTGRLRREIETYALFGAKEIIIKAEAIDPRTGVDYAPIREYGLDGHRVQPFFRHNADVFFTRLRQRLDRTIKQIFKK